MAGATQRTGSRWQEKDGRQEAAECGQNARRFPRACCPQDEEDAHRPASREITLNKGQARRITWVVKASKLCNLRCRYCYEWEDLAKRDRMTLEQWRSLLIAIRRYHETISGQLDVEIESNIDWHGGEPLLLPTEYISAVMALERDILGEEALELGYYKNFLQTNLYSVTEEKLELLSRENVGLGVSLDLIGGVRLSVAGRETEDRVAANIDILTQHGIDFGAIVVVAGHTLTHLTEIYDFYETLGVGVRFLPLFDSPLNEAGASFAATYPELVTALERLFEYWIDRPRRTRVSPFHEYLDTIRLKMMGRSRRSRDRRANGEDVLLVNTDGSLYERADAYDRTKVLGNVFEQTIDEIVSSESYRASLDRDEATATRYCGSCEFRGACDTSPLFESPRRDSGEARCHLAYPLYRFIDGYVREKGYTPADLQRILTLH